jgi:hypothetical protein
VLPHRAHHERTIVAQRSRNQRFVREAQALADVARALLTHDDVEANTVLELAQVDRAEMHGPSVALDKVILAVQPMSVVTSVLYPP